jgi:hypothetical protein
MDQPKSTPAQSPVDLDRKEDRFGLKPQKPRYAPDITGSAVFRQIARSIKREAYKATLAKNPIRIRKGWQKCMVKVKFNGPKSGGKNLPRWVRHAGYITLQNRTGLDPKVAGFDQHSDEVDIRKAVTEWHDAKDRRMFRIIISPENPNSDLKRLTRDMMKEAGAQLGRNLEWKAAIHLNTDHPHVHLVLRGVANGSALALPREMICGGMSQIARDHLTRQLGHRLYAFEPPAQQEQQRRRSALREL